MGETAQDFLLLLLAEGHGCVGKPEVALEMVAEAVQSCNKTGQRWMEAEHHRLAGELTLQKFKARPEPFDSAQDRRRRRVQGSQFKGEDEAEECFQKALDVARQQKAKSWELRAATSLARLWQGQGKKQEACDLLAPVYNWFTEGFDTADLKEAKALLEALT